MHLVRIILLASAALPLMAGEYVFLASGSILRADRHEDSGDIVRLYTGTGTIELPKSAVAGYEEFAEPEPEPLPEPPPAAVPLEDALPPEPLDPRAMVREAAIRAGLPPEFVESVALVESAFQPNALSPKGAIGVMQLMPGTAKELGVDPYDLKQNIEAGTRLLRDLLIKYDGDVVKALSAYNAGEGAVARYRGLPPYLETRLYVNKVIRKYLEASGK